MSKQRSGLVLLAMIAIAAVMLASYLLAAPRDDVQPGSASWISTHPADWVAASELTDKALDSESSQRFELWRAAYALAQRTAPRHRNANAALVRSGLFHWYELNEADRKAVIAAAEPLLREPETYRSLHVPLWQLTRDFALLRRTNPGDAASLRSLAQLAAMNGLFDEYRALRTRVQRRQFAEFQERRDDLTATDLVVLTPAPPDKGDEPLVRGILEELQTRPDHASVQLPERLVDFAIRNQIPGVLAPDTRKFTHEPQWRGTCGANEICHFASADVIIDRPLVINVQAVQSDEIPPWIEVYVDDVLVDEGAVSPAKQFTINATEGPHHVELRMANPRTRNGAQRRVRLS